MRFKKCIDSHVHISFDTALCDNLKIFRKLMDRTGTERINFLALNAHPFFEETELDNSKCLYLKSKFAPYGYSGYCLDYSKEKSANGFYEQIKLAINAGFDCWKVIEAKPNSQAVCGFRFDDKIYDKALSLAEEKSFPIIIHCADPIQCWDTDYKEGYLQKQEYQQQVYNVLERHPNLVLTFAHFGFMGDKPDFVEQLFNKYKNVYLDNVPAPEEYFVISENHEKWKRIFEKYSDRIIFGTDRGNHPIENKTEEEYFTLYPETVSYEKRILNEDGICDGRHPFPGIEEHWGKEWYGLNISDEAFNNIVYNNFIRVYGEPKKVNYELLKEIAIYEFSLPHNSASHDKDFKEIMLECEKNKTN